MMATSPPSSGQNDKFALPGASFDRVKEILKAYGSREEPMTVADVATMVGTHTSSVSRNSRFLLGTGLVTEGATRKLTPEGRELFSALSLEDDVASRQCWGQVVDRTQFLRDRLTTLRLKKSMTRDRFTALILAAPGVSATASTRAGARAVVDLLIESGRIHDDSGSLTVVPELGQDTAPTRSATAEAPVAEGASQEAETNSVSASVQSDASEFPAALSSLSKIAINIELHIPETRDAEVYQKLFRALREELLQPRKD